ncbi:MAG: zinc-binding dehydrogenase [Prevotellaceae bacterium]|jgi:threonine dehydrogenase-like Zn-dependent dehydrogenase|nr:zinc-binding dehydrogenase [Prevotellaceae bacterium]
MNDKFKGFCLNGTERFNPGASIAVERNASIVERDTPEPGEGEILARTLYTSICGSDVSACMGKPNFDWIQRPRIIGHETCAEVVKLHPDYRGNLKPGDRFVPVAQLGCRKDDCPGCRAGKWNLCPDKTILGYHRDGAFGQMMTLEADRALPLAKGLEPWFGAIVEPLSVAVNAVYSKCSIKPGMNVLVTGCGIMGLMAAELARASGAEVAITGIDLDKGFRLKAAKERGFAAIVVSETKPLLAQLSKGVRSSTGATFGEKGKVDLLIECSGIPQALAEAIYAVKPEHDVCIIATYPHAAELDVTHITRQSLNLKGVMGSSKDNFLVAMELLRRNVFPAKHYMDIYGFSHIEQAFRDSIRARNVKAVIKMD